ncbi:MAG TPA: ABC transporter permease [Blastocatellia bacterium]|jgi:putative ABC transport system permease protein|nr:ABC transporter permease [Blastocatellia bacterium]
MQTLWQDLRYGARMLLKNPGFALIAVITIALGIGANTAIFSVVNAALLRPLPYEESERLVVLYETNPQQGRDEMNVSYLNFADWRAQSKSFDQLAACLYGGMVLTGKDELARLQIAAVSADFFAMLRVKPLRGRIFLPEEDKVGGAPVVVVSHALWQSRFGGDEGLIGRQITLDGKSRTVIGVMPPNFAFPPGDQTEVWIAIGSLANQMRQLQNRGVHMLTVVGRLKPDVTLQQAQTELATIDNRIQQQNPDADPGHGVSVISGYESLTKNARPALLTLVVAVGFLLLIACANVANLLLARAETRQKEIAIRAALGATRGRIVWQLLTESLLLAVVGGAVGLLLAAWGVDALAGGLPEDFPRAKEIGIDRVVLGFTGALSVLTGLIFGIIPALTRAKPALNETLKEGGRTGAAFGRGRMRSALIVTEVALSLALLIGAGLLIKSFWRLTQVNPGFQSDHLLTMNVSLIGEKYKETGQVISFFREIPLRLGALPGVKAVSAVSVLPISGGDGNGGLTIEGREFPPAQTPSASFRRILPNYFSAMGIPLKQGREFNERDTGEEKVVIINESMARRFWPEGDAIGKHIKVGPPQNEPWLTIVGVAGDVRNIGLEADARLATYEPHAQRPWNSMTLAIRTETDPLSLSAAVRGELRAMEKGLLIRALSTMDERIRLSVAPRRFNMALLAVFAALALLLAAVGVYGVMSYTVTQRTHEIGVRMALGAQSGAVLKLIVGQGLKLALIGVTIGLAAAFALTRWMEDLLFSVRPTDSWTYGVVAALLMVVALFACWIPARRAAKVDPMVALRCE